jgi:hypothetical protein
MAEMRENYMPKERGFGGKMGSRKTMWIVIVVIIVAIAAGALYMFPQYL